MTKFKSPQILSVVSQSAESIQSVHEFVLSSELNIAYAFDTGPLCVSIQVCTMSNTSQSHMCQEVQMMLSHIAVGYTCALHLRFAGQRSLASNSSLQLHARRSGWQHIQDLTLSQTYAKVIMTMCNNMHNVNCRQEVPLNSQKFQGMP